jgi:signal transduction histidine kinase
MNPSGAHRLAFFCRDNGSIIEVISDDLGVFEPQGSGEGRLFQNLIDEANRSKAFELLVAVKVSRVAVDFQLNLAINNELRTLYFMGVLIGDRILIVGANNHKDVVEFTNQMQEITNEQANLIRTLVKEQVQLKSKNGDVSLFDEISKLNNELVNLQRELTRKNMELQNLNQLKNKFLGMAAHDLRSPLNVIQSFSEFILDEAGDELNPDHKKFLGIILNSTQFMLTLIEDLLDISKIESGNVDLEKTVYNLVDQVRICVELNQVMAVKKKIFIKFNPELNSVMLCADRNKTEQVLNNLITNAMKFSHPESEIHINLVTDGEFAAVSVRDYGMGIPAEKLDSIFTPFTKAGTKGTKGEKSTGLGLSIVKRIVEAQGGKINVFSEPGKGSEFVFTIPAIHKP